MPPPLRAREAGSITGPDVARIATQIPVTVVQPVTKLGKIWYPPHAAPNPGPRRLGRRRLATGPATELAAGNSVQRGDARTGAPSYPTLGIGGAATPLGADRNVSDRDAHPELARTPRFQHDRLVAADRHILADRGTTKSSNMPSISGGYPNPEHDGPPMPGYRMINRVLSWQLGTDGTAYLDNDGYHATTNTTDGRAWPLADQGSPWTRYNGGTPRLYRPYGARGYVEGPEPATRALPGDGSGRPPGYRLAPGDPADGPQKIYSGVPHGLHTPTVPPPVVTQARQKNIPQQRPPAQMRPANSKIAGQSYSQTVVHLDGTRGGVLPRMNSGRQPGMNSGRLRR